MLKILGRPNSMNVQKVLWGCAELGIDYEREDIGGEFGGNDQPDYLKLNPNGLIPTLIDDDLVLWESNTILRYLAASYGDESLYPTDLKIRARGEKWMDWSLSVQSPALFPVFHGLIRGNPLYNTPEKLAPVRDKLGEVMGRLDYGLSGGGFIAGDQFTICDIPVGIGTYRWFELDIEREEYPHLAAWYARLRARPGFQEFIDIGLS